MLPHVPDGHERSPGVVSADPGQQTPQLCWRLLLMRTRGHPGVYGPQVCISRFVTPTPLMLAHDMSSQAEAHAMVPLPIMMLQGLGTFCATVVAYVSQCVVGHM